MKKVALVVGHLKNSQGATCYNGESEYVFNGRIAEKIAEHLKGIVETKIIYRDYDSRYGKSRNKLVKAILKEWGDVHLCFELHFNAVSYVARGCELLVMNDHKRRGTHDLAKKAIKRLSDVSGIERRRGSGLKILSSSGRGSDNLEVPEKYAKHLCLIEPAFLNTRNPDSEWIVNNEDLYAEIVAEMIAKDFCGEEMPEDSDSGDNAVNEELIRQVENLQKANQILRDKVDVYTKELFAIKTRISTIMEG